MTDPTPLELMAFADGELEEPRASEVAAFLSSDVEAARSARVHVLETQRLGDLVVMAVAPLNAGATPLVDDVMAAIDRMEAADRYAASVPPPPASVRGMRLGASGAGRSRPPPASKRTATRATSGAAVALFVTLAAAAVGLVWWREAPKAQRSAPVATVLIEEGAISSVDPSDDHDNMDGTSITSIDFGAQHGTIFYVPGQTRTTTAVIWISDEDTSP